MSAPPGPRAFRGGSRPPSRARGTFAPRGHRNGPEDNAPRKERPTSNHYNGAASLQTRAWSRGGPARGPSRTGTARGAPPPRAQTRQIRNAPSSAVPSPMSDAQRDATTQEQPAYRAYMEKTYTTLDEQRKKERKDATRDGLLADPDKPTTLANAITIVGTCQDMCAEHERVQRIVQLMVDDCEKVPHATKENTKVPLEDRMVKRYRRPAAGYEEQLPSDIRPPLVLRKTLDYLMDELVGGPESLANVHKFVWDRTRAIRNDFSIQQVTKVDELRIAISCFERIARFHILSLHQLSKASDNSVDFDAYQEREQLNNTLLSLMYYYDDSRHKLVSPNEPEFRAYCIIFEVQDQRPDLEDRAQNWPSKILKDRRVQTALKLYAAAANASDDQGPLRPQEPNAIAQANTTHFFGIIQSPAVPYLMACVAEVYFNKVRRTALDTIWKAYRVKRGAKGRVEDWTLGDVTVTLGFDEEDETQRYCEDHGFTVSENQNGEAYVDLGSISGRYLSDTNVNRKQAFSTNLVEQKRKGRTLPAVINGWTASQAQAQGLVTEDYSDNDGPSTANDESLFLPDDPAIVEPAKEPMTNGANLHRPNVQEKPNKEPSNANPFLQPSTTPFKFSETPNPDTSTSSFFGKPSISTSFQSSTQLFAPQSNRPDTAKPSPFSIRDRPGNAASLFSNTSKPEIKTPSFDFAKPSASQTQPSVASSAPPPSSIFNLQPSSTPEPPKLNFGAPPLFNSIGTTDAPQTEKNDTNVDFSAKPSPKAAESRPDGQKASPFGLFNSTPPTDTSPSSLFPPAQTSATSKDTSPKISQPAFSSFFPTPVTSSLPSQTSTEHPDQPASPLSFDFAQPSLHSPKPSFFPQPDNTAKSPQLSFQPTPSVANQAIKAPASSLFDPKPSPSVISIPNPVVPAVDPRPAVLEALAEGLLMEDQGLLQQFIEYTIGPIVHEAFQEVEDEASWKRAREIRTVLLSRKYLQHWRNVVWKRKLMRKGKERRAIFAKSMQEMKSSRQRPSQSQPSFQSSLLEEGQDASKVDGQENSMPPPPQPRSGLKRKSLPTEFPNETLPDADSNKRKRQRQESPGRTKDIRHSLQTPSQPHHRRSRIMGDSRKFGSPCRHLPDFSQLDQSSYSNEKVVQKAKRLAGQAKLDTTRGDYFALKARGIDPDTLSTPQSGLKRSRVDDQIERVRKLLKPSPPEANKFTLQSDQPLSNGNSSSNLQLTAIATTSSNSDAHSSPADLLAQLREVREAMAESTAWMQSEREKSERLSSTRSSDVAHRLPSTQPSLQSSQSQLQDHRPREWNPTPTRAQQRLERTKANGLLSPDWDWNKSITEWKLRGGTRSPRPAASREQSVRSTPAATGQQGKKPIGFAAATEGLGRRRQPVKKERDVVYDDEEESFEEDEDAGEEYEDEDDDEEGEEYANGYAEEYSEEYEEEEEGVQPQRAVLKARGKSADTAIDLDD